MKNIPGTLFMTFTLLMASYVQAQQSNVEPAAQAPVQNTQPTIQADSIRKPSNGQKQTVVEQPYNQVPVQNYQQPQPIQAQVQYYPQPVQGQNYYVQPQVQSQVQYYVQPYSQGQNYYVDEQGRSYPVQPQGQVQYYTQPNIPSEGYVSNTNAPTNGGEWYSADDYPQPPIFNQEANRPCCEPQVKPPKAVTCNTKNWRATLAFRLAAFCPLVGNMRRIYDHAIPFYQGEATYSYGGPISAWFNAGYLGKSGRSVGEEDRTYLRLVPIGIGLKYSFYLPYCWQGYVGAGPAYSFLTIHDHSDFNRHIRREALGAMVKLGFTYEFWRCAFLDLFVDYYYTEFKFSGNRNCIRRNDLDASALICGAGIGWNF